MKNYLFAISLIGISFFIFINDYQLSTKIHNHYLDQNNEVVEIKSPIAQNDKFIFTYFDYKEQKIFTNNIEELYNKTYQPGSVIKIITTLVLLENPLFFSYRYYCSGKDFHNNIQCDCWIKEGHKQQNFEDAFINSCNLFFLSLYKEVDIPYFMKNVEKMLNYKIENLGLKFKFNNSSNLDDRKIIIGTSKLYNVAPIHLLSLLRYLNDNKNSKIKTLIYLMEQTIKKGTAKNAYNPKYYCYGKTGTIKYDYNQYGWFLGVYTNQNSKKYALVVLSKDGSGPIEASPYAMKLSEYLYDKK